MINRQVADKALDEAIAKVDETIPALRRMAAVKKQKSTTDRLPADKAKKAKKAFQEMCDDPLLNEKRDDICLCAKDRLGKCGCRKHESA